jgi:hypothetical protein
VLVPRWANRSLTSWRRRLPGTHNLRHEGRRGDVMASVTVYLINGGEEINFISIDGGYPNEIQGSTGSTVFYNINNGYHIAKAEYATSNTTADFTVVNNEDPSPVYLNLGIT